MTPEQWPARTLRGEVPRKLNQHFADILGALDDGEEEQLLFLLKKLRQQLGDGR